MLRKEVLDEKEAEKEGEERMKDEDFLRTFREKLRDKALTLYKNELTVKSAFDLGLHGVTRAHLRILCRQAVLDASASVKRRYSNSALSSNTARTFQKDTMSAFRQLQHERLIVSRMGFPEKAFELDREIERMRIKVKKAREIEDAKILENRMNLLTMSHKRKEGRLEYILAEETKEVHNRFRDEEEKCLKRQETEFLRVLELATRRAIGRVKKCNCTKGFLCRHNKTASYNTRRPSKTVVQYRRNGKRLRHSGRPEEGLIWDEKAKEIDEKQQEEWRNRIALSIVHSPWGANEAVIDQITESHKKELAILRKTHQVKRDMHEKRHVMRRRNFRNTILAEERKVRTQCRKAALIRSKVQYSDEQKEIKRQEEISYKSDGLKNVSKNLLGLEFDDDERKAVDWVAPTSFGLDNSVRLVDALKEVKEAGKMAEMNETGQARIFTSFRDIKRAEKAKNEDSDDDGSGENEDDDDDEQVDTYQMGVTSGSKFVDKLRVAAKKDEASAAMPSKPDGFGQGFAQNMSWTGGSGSGGGAALSTAPSTPTVLGGWMPTTGGSNFSSFTSPASFTSFSGSMGNNNTITTQPTILGPASSIPAQEEQARPVWQGSNATLNASSFAPSGSMLPSQPQLQWSITPSIASEPSTTLAKSFDLTQALGSKGAGTLGGFSTFPASSPSSTLTGNVQGWTGAGASSEKLSSNTMGETTMQAKIATTAFSSMFPVSSSVFATPPQHTSYNSGGGSGAFNFALTDPSTNALSFPAAFSTTPNSSSFPTSSDEAVLPNPQSAHDEKKKIEDEEEDEEDIEGGGVQLKAIETPIKSALSSSSGMKKKKVVVSSASRHVAFGQNEVLLFKDDVGESTSPSNLSAPFTSQFGGQSTKFMFSASSVGISSSNSHLEGDKHPKLGNSSSGKTIDEEEEEEEEAEEVLSPETSRDSNWGLAFSRISLLADLKQSLLKILNDDVLFEAAELYASTVAGINFGEESEGEEAEDSGASWRLTLQLRILRCWKKDQSCLEGETSGEEEELALGLQELFDLSGEEIDEKTLAVVLKEKHNDLDALFNSTAETFVPNFILSNDFFVHFEESCVQGQTSSASNALASKEWRDSFVRVMDTFPLAIHLLPKSKQVTSKPFGNAQLKQLIGASLCEESSPLAYLHHDTEPAVSSRLVQAIKNGEDNVEIQSCILRTSTLAKIGTSLYVKTLQDNKGVSQFVLIIFFSPLQKKLVENFVEALP